MIANDPWGTHIRPATAADVADFDAAHLTMPQTSWTAADFATELTVDESRMWLLELRAQGGATWAVGGVLCYRVMLPDVELMQIAVATGLRRHGLGGQLMAHCATQVRAAGATRIHLDVRADNSAAIRLYERYDFVIVGRRRAYYRDGADALLMDRVLEGGPPIA